MMGKLRFDFRSAMGGAAVVLLAAAASAADPLADLELQYQTAVAVLKKPSVTGILLTEVSPDSAAAARGLRAGDILQEYYGTKVTTLQALTEQVAEALARRLTDENTGKDVLARVRRGEQDITIQLPREALGIRGVEVEAGVSGPRNPPPDLRGTLALDWKAVVQTVRADAEGAMAFRLLERTEYAANATQPRFAPRSIEEEWLGWETCVLTAEGEDALAGTVDIYHVLSAATQPSGAGKPLSEHSRVTFRMQLGDYKVTPAFVLTETGARYAAPSGQENMQVEARAKRVGETLQTSSVLQHVGLVTEGTRPEQHENAAPLNAAPQAALPWIAAALPLESGHALGLYLLTVRDFLPRPGYVLATRGRASMPEETGGVDARPTTVRAPAAAPWRVDLMHCGVIIESYWFSDQRRLLCVQTQGPQTVVARRVDNEKSAMLPMERKVPTTKPAANP